MDEAKLEKYRLADIKADEDYAKFTAIWKATKTDEDYDIYFNAYHHTVVTYKLHACAQYLYDNRHTATSDKENYKLCLEAFESLEAEYLAYDFRKHLQPGDQ